MDERISFTGTPAAAFLRTIEARGEVTEALGSKVIQQAKNGDFKSQELWLTTKGGWSKQQTNTNVDIPAGEDEANSALENLLSKLGINKEET